MNTHIRHALRVCARPLIRFASRGYVAGPELTDAVQACRRISVQEMASTIGYWNDDNEAPETVAQTHIQAIETIANEGLASYVSIKAPALNFNQALVNTIITKGMESRIGIHFDSLSLEAAGKTFELIAHSTTDHSRIGCTLPGRWQRSIKDTDRVAELGINVRVVKGQWIDPNNPEMNLRTGFLNVIRNLAGRVRHVAVATHDPELARTAITLLHKAGTPCEMELLLGLPLHASMQVAKEFNVSVRLYVPFGYSWFPYALSQGHKNPLILWWTLKDALLGRSIYSTP